MNLIAVIILLLAFHYFLFITRLYFGIQKVKKQKNSSMLNSFVSIVIVFRNEELNLNKVIKSLNELKSDANNFEVIFVNDNSTDNSVQIIKDTIKLNNYNIVDLAEVKESRAFKKRAIEQAVKIAEGEIIFLTDADCVIPSGWINSVLSCFDEDVAFVTGPVTFIEESSFFQKFQKLEYAGLNLVGAGLIGSGRPKLASAANLAFRKNVFELIHGYEGNEHLSSGDDELLMQKIQDETSYKIKYCFSKDALVKTKGNATLLDFANQRRRWASKSLFYKDKYFVMELVLIALFYFSIPASLILALFIGQNFLQVFGITILLKMIPEYFVLRNGSNILFNSTLLFLFPIAQLFQIPYIIISAILGVKGNFNWKGRTLQR